MQAASQLQTALFFLWGGLISLLAHQAFAIEQPASRDEREGIWYLLSQLGNNSTGGTCCGRIRERPGHPSLSLY